MMIALTILVLLLCVLSVYMVISTVVYTAPIAKRQLERIATIDEYYNRVQQDTPIVRSYRRPGTTCIKDTTFIPVLNKGYYGAVAHHDTHAAISVVAFKQAFNK